MTKEQVLKELHAFYEANAKQYHLKKMGLFGSVARNEMHEESDIDIVVEFEKPNLLQQAALMIKLQELFGRSVDVVALWKKMNPRLRSHIERDVIYV